MATKYTPLTTQTPMAVANTKGIDDMIGVINSLLEYHKTKADTQWQNQQREYQSGQQKLTLQEQQKDTEALSLAGSLQGKEYTSTQLLPLEGRIPANQYKALMLNAKDVKQADAQRLNATVQLMGEVEGDIWMKPSAIIAKAAETGADADEILKRQQNMQADFRQQQGAGKGGGTGSGEGKEKKLTEGEEKARATKIAMREGGLTFNGKQVYAYGTDTRPNVQLRDEKGNAYKYDANGYYKAKRGSKDYKKIKRKDVPKDILPALDNGYKAFQDAHIVSQNTGAFSFTDTP